MVTATAAAGAAAAAVVGWRAAHPGGTLAASARRRLRCRTCGDAPPADAPPPGARPPGAPPPSWPGAVLALAVVIAARDGWGLLLGTAAWLAVRQILGRGERRADVVCRAELLAQVPEMLELLAVCLRAGAALERAVSAVADVVAPPGGEVLAEVASRLQIGLPPETAWSALVGRADPHRVPAALGWLARAAPAAARSGAPLADQLNRLAAASRAEGARTATVAAARMGVRAVVPLGLLFLPAFLLLVVAPFVIGAASSLLQGH